MSTFSVRVNINAMPSNPASEQISNTENQAKMILPWYPSKTRPSHQQRKLLFIPPSPDLPPSPPIYPPPYRSSLYLSYHPSTKPLSQLSPSPSTRHMVTPIHVWHNKQYSQSHAHPTHNPPPLSYRTVHYPSTLHSQDGTKTQ